MAAFGACRGGGLQTGLRGRRIEQAGRPGRKLGFRAQSRDGGQQLAPMPDRSYAKADQVFGREFGQHIAINIVVAEGALILFKAETIKPGYNVHLCPPDLRSRYIGVVSTQDCSFGRLPATSNSASMTSATSS